MNLSSSSTVVLVGGFVCGTALGFAPNPLLLQPRDTASLAIRRNRYIHDNTIFTTSSSSTKRQMVPRYGPKPKPNNNNNNATQTSSSSSSPFFSEDQEEWERKDEARVADQRVSFMKMLDQLMAAETPEEMPSIVTPYLDVILSMRGYEGTDLMEEALTRAEAEGDEDRVTQVAAACDYVVSFTEAFVDEAKRMDDAHKKLLGSIVRAMMVETKDSGATATTTAAVTEVEREERLDRLLTEEREKFTPAFLRHLQGEVRRIERAPRMSPESAKMLQILRVIQIRVLEELGKDLGEAAQILGQLLGYDDEEERVAVLETGLSVRGVGFAREMSDLATEAIRGFREDVPEGVADPELVQRIQDLHRHIERFLELEEEKTQSSSWE